MVHELTDALVRRSDVDSAADFELPWWGGANGTRGDGVNGVDSLAGRCTAGDVGGPHWFMHWFVLLSVAAIG